MIGHNIKRYREYKNLTQEYMAAKLGVAQSSYSRIESNSVDISFSKLEIIAEILGVSVAELVAPGTTFNLFQNENANALVINQYNRSSQSSALVFLNEYIEELKAEIEFLKETVRNLTGKNQKKKKQ